MKTKILTILRGADDFVSGQELCEGLKVSRTAIWKNINQLKKDGYQIEAVQNKGYRIVDTPDAITQEEIESLLAGTQQSMVASTVYYKEEVGSTNTVAKQLAEEGAPSGTLVVADMQTQGRGRRGRSWCSPKGASVYMTLLLRPEIAPENASMLTLVMGLSVVQAISKEYGLDAKIKWPNDIVVSNKKVCGILTEMSAQIDYINYLVIGTGINVNNEIMPSEVENMATSIAMELGHKVKRADLIVKVIEAFQKNYKIFIKHNNLGNLVEEYNKVLINMNKNIKVLEPNNEYTGIARGINQLGELLVEVEGKGFVCVYAGEVSVRGLYGYVE